MILTFAVVVDASAAKLSKEERDECVCENDGEDSREEGEEGGRAFTRYGKTKERDAEVKPKKRRREERRRRERSREEEETENETRRRNVSAKKVTKEEDEEDEDEEEEQLNPFLNAFFSLSYRMGNKCC